MLNFVNKLKRIERRLWDLGIRKDFVEWFY